MAKSKHQKSLIYKEICRHFKPVFSHFFMEYFTDPGLWYERRLAYTRCMAASSIGMCMTTYYIIMMSLSSGLYNGSWRQTCSKYTN